MNSVGFATTYSLVDLLDELPLPKALNLIDSDRLFDEHLDIQNVQELQDIAAVVAPAIQMARLPSDLDRLRFKDSAHAPSPNMRHHHAQASPMMSILVTKHQQFQDIITVPPYQIPTHVRAPQPQQPLAVPASPVQTPSPVRPQFTPPQYSPSRQQQAPNQHYVAKQTHPPMQPQPPPPQQQQQQQPHQNQQHQQQHPQQQHQQSQPQQQHLHQHQPHQHQQQPSPQMQPTMAIPQQQVHHHHHHHQNQNHQQRQQQHHHQPHPSALPQAAQQQLPMQHTPPQMTPMQISPTQAYSPVAHPYAPPHPLQQPQQQPSRPQQHVGHHPQIAHHHPPQMTPPSHLASPQYYGTPPTPALLSPQTASPAHRAKQHIIQSAQHHLQPQPQIAQQPVHVMKQQTVANQQPPKPPKPTQTSSSKRKTERERQKERERKALKSEVMIDTRNSTLEEVLEKFLQDTISEQMGAIADGGLLCNFTPKQLLHLVAITAKLKRKNRTKNVNLSKLTSLMTTLSSQLQVQTEVLKNNSYVDNSHSNSESGDEADNNEDSSEHSRMQKFETCCDCAVTALNIMTSSNMDSRIYLEECVEAIVNFVNTALTIITDTTSGNYCTSPKKSNKQHNDRRLSRRVLFTKQCLSKLNAKCSEVLALVNDLLACRTEATLNDSLLLSTSRAALTAFFLMDSSASSNELQLNALNVITAIFASYKNHQNVILEELIHSIARLPTTKRNRVQYQIGSNNSESISIFSALIMKIIQSLFTIRKSPRSEDKSSHKPNSSQESVSDEPTDYERLLKGQYHSALRASYAFLSSFLRRCCGVDKKDDCDYRVLFETFVDDLMTCLYKPDWSSAQLITHVLIKLLISNINPQPGKKNQQQTNQTLKLASLEHLGTICARLIKEKSTLSKYKDEVKKALDAIDLSGFALSSEQKNDIRSKRLRPKPKQVRKKVTLDDSDTEEETGAEDEQSNIYGDSQDDDEETKILTHEDEQKFWLALLTFCQREKGVTKCGRNIFCAIWLKELERRAKIQYELNNPASHETESISDDEESNSAQMNNPVRQYSRQNNEDSQKQTNGPPVEEIQARLVQDFFKLLSISAKRAFARARNLNIENSGDRRQENSITPESADEDSTIDETTASNIIKILDVSLPTTQRLIDASLSHIVAALSTTANTNIRSRAMKSLSHVLNDAPKECAPKLLARDDLQKAIGASLLDQSTSVRESTVELVGRFILNSQSEALIDKYYDMLTNRIMDSGVSVRKRVIKILREICINYPSYPRVPEICSIIIKRINDEGEGIRKLVSETFSAMWFKEERTHEAVVTKVACITHVVATVWSKILAEANKSTGTESHFEWLHLLLSSLLKVKPNTDEQTNHVAKRKSRNSEVEQNEDGEIIPQETINVNQTISASTQIISVLVSEKLANGSQESTSRADCLATMTTLWSFAKISPLLLTHHLDLFQSFLSIEAKSSFDLLILEKVIQIIELILPAISNPSVSVTNSIEANLAKLILRGAIRVIPVSVSCLSELIHRHTHNNQLANDTFRRFLRIIRAYRANPDSFESHHLASFFRALYTCGLLAKYFDVDDRDVLYHELVQFVESGIDQMNSRYQDERILLRSLEGLGFIFEKTPNLMLRESTTRIYRFFMKRAIDLHPNDSAASSSCVLANLRNYLQVEVKSDIDWSCENLKEMTPSKQEDANSTQSSVIQLYLRDMLSCALSSNTEIRKAAIKLIHSVHNGGHINPLSIVPSLIALSSDEDSTIRVRADHVLQEIERKFSNFVNMKSKQGVLESFILNRRKRGFLRLDVQNSESQSEQTNDASSINVIAKLSTLYAVVATSRQQRRAFINGLLRYFDIQTLTSAPNILCSDPNQSRFILSKCDGCNILQYIIDNIMFLPFTLLDEPFFLVHQIGITMSNLVSQSVSLFGEILQSPDGIIPVGQMKDLVSMLHRCILLMHCRKVTLDMYNITEQKFEEYTPNESAKVTDKPTHRRNLDEQSFEMIAKVPSATVHFDSEPYLRSIYSGFFGLEDGQQLLVPDRHSLEMEYKRFSGLMIGEDL